MRAKRHHGNNGTGTQAEEGRKEGESEGKKRMKSGAPSVFLTHWEFSQEGRKGPTHWRGHVSWKWTQDLLKQSSFTPFIGMK